MEAHGTIDCATLIFDMGPGYMHTFLSDDGSLSCATLHHPLDFKKAYGVLSTGHVANTQLEKTLENCHLAFLNWKYFC